MIELAALALLATHARVVGPDERQAPRTEGLWDQGG
jgi:hypothetical protein